MSDVIRLTKELKEELDNLPLFQEYKRIYELVSSNEELNELHKEICKVSKTSDTKRHQELLDRYNSHPLIVNKRELEAEVKDYLSEISDIINAR